MNYYQFILEGNIFLNMECKVFCNAQFLCVNFLNVKFSFCPITFQSRGGGFEVEMYYPQWRRINKPIDRHHVLLDSLAKLIEGQLSHIIIFTLFRLEYSSCYSSVLLQQPIIIMSCCQLHHSSLYGMYLHGA